jgi:hypothetical protein
MNKENKISEVDLMIYALSVEKKYYGLLELYGMLIEHSTCKKCKHNSNAHFKIINEIIERFGDAEAGIAIPTSDELSQVSRDITIWRGLQGYTEEAGSLALRVEEYAERYKLTPDGVYKIRNKVETLVQQFQQMKRVFRRYKA